LRGQREDVHEDGSADTDRAIGDAAADGHRGDVDGAQERQIQCDGEREAVAVTAVASVASMIALLSMNALVELVSTLTETPAADAGILA